MNGETEYRITAAETKKQEGKRNNKVPDEKRQDLIELYFNQSYDLKEAAKITKMKYTTAWKIINVFKETSRVNSLPKGGSRIKKLTPEILDQIEEIISDKPDSTLKEIKIKLERHPGLKISLQAISVGLKSLMITLKKSHRELQVVNSESSIEKRKLYAIWFNDQFKGNYSTAIFIDESPFNLHLKRTQARSKVGTRENVIIPAVRGRNVSLICSISVDGVAYSKVISNSTVNGDIYAEYIRELCLYLRDNKNFQNACLIMDNARIHRPNDLEFITTEFGYTFKFLSPYSYMVNPIECAFSKIKNVVRSMLRSKKNGDLVDCINEGLQSITTTDCIGYYRHMTTNIIKAAAGLPYNHK